MDRLLSREETIEPKTFARAGHEKETLDENRKYVQPRPLFGLAVAGRCDRHAQ